MREDKAVMYDLTEFGMPDVGSVCLVRALHSLRDEHVADLSEGLPGLPGMWSLERHESYDGHLSAVLIPQEESEASLVVSRAADGFHLAANQGDDYDELGCFSSVEELMTVVRAAIMAAGGANRLG